MKYAVIENEEYLRENLIREISCISPNAECAFTAETVEDSVRFFQSLDAQDINLIFMDIELDDGSCFEIFEEVEITIPIIFTTSYSEYAIKAFQVNSIDYLLKPISETELRKALEKYEKYGRTEQVERGLYRSLEPYASLKSPRKRLLVSNGNGYTFISASEIAWIEAEDRYVSIVTVDGNLTLTDIKSLTDVGNVLDPENFFQVSRGVIVSIEAIRNVTKYFKGRLKVEMQAGTRQRRELVSAARREQFLEWLGYT